MKLRRILTGLFLVLLTTLLAACGDKEAKSENVGGNQDELDNLTESGLPIVKDKIELNIFAGKAPATADNWNDVLVFNEYEKMTNIDVNWEMVPHNSLTEKRNLALASGNLPDAFHSAAMPVSDVIKYAEQGTFIPLNDLIDEYAPNFKSVLEENPEIEKALTMPDGKIYSLPLMAEADLLAYRIGPLPWINEEWLDALGLDLPETTDDFYNYLKAVKEGDPNGNGEADEIPYGGPSIDSLFQYLRGAFGLANAGPANANVDLDPDTEELRFYPITDGYKKLMEYMNTLFEEGLIEQNIFSIESDQYHAQATEGLYGSTVWYSPIEIFGKEAGEQLTGIPALEGPDGHKTFTNLGSQVMNPAAFIITNANEHPEATMRWIDYFYGEEGLKLFFMGIEGETYEVQDDGSLEYMDHILNSEEGLSLEQEQAKYLTFPGGGWPSIAKRGYFRGPAMSDKAAEAAERLEPNIVDPWPAFIYTNEENDKLSVLGADIDKYVEEMRDKFISGDEPLSNWDKYVETIEKMKLDEYMQIKGQAYERYKES